MAFYSKEFQKEVNSRNSIIEVMEEHGEIISGQGKTRSFICPMCNGDFENSKIWVEKNHFHCFRCPNVRGAVFKGGPIQYIQLRWGYSFTEAIEKMAERAGISLEEQKKPQTVDPEKTELYTEVMKYYERYSDRAAAYLGTRGLSQTEASSVVKKYRIGYAPGAMNLRTFLTEKGFTIQQLRKYHLLSEGGSDKFFHRIVVPIVRRGIPYDFYTRRVDQMDFLKHWPLEGRGMDFGADFIPKNAPVIDIYESVINKLFGEVAGYPYGIATGGISNLDVAALISWLRWISPKRVRLVLDPDRQGQGQNAALAMGEAITKAGIQVDVVLLPLGHDVGDLFQRGERGTFVDAMNQPLPFPIFRAHLLLKDIPAEIIDQHMNWRQEASCTSEKAQPLRHSAIFYSQFAQ